MGTKERDYLFDNYKALLIVLVVVGHFVEVGADDHGFLYSLKWIIFSFHMPAFIFISGYFSKKKYSAGVLVQKLLVPYLIFEVFYYLLYTFVIHKDTELYLFYPKFTLWYLMALFVWKWVTPWVKKIPGHMILAVAAGLGIGAAGLDDNFLTLPRMITFYPFFLFGVHFDRKCIAKFSGIRYRIGAGILFALLNVVLIWTAVFSRLSPKIFYGRYDYEYLDLGIAEGVLIRLGCYAVAFAMTMLLAVLLPEKENRFSSLGSRTMPIYLFHGLVYSCFKMGKPIYDSLGNMMESVFVILVSLLVVWVLSRKPFADFTNWISGLSFRKIYEKSKRRL